MILWWSGHQWLTPRHSYFLSMGRVFLDSNWYLPHKGLHISRIHKLPLSFLERFVTVGLTVTYYWCPIHISFQSMRLDKAISWLLNMLFCAVALILWHFSMIWLIRFSEYLILVDAGGLVNKYFHEHPWSSPHTKLLPSVCPTFMTNLLFLYKICVA